MWSNINSAQLFRIMNFFGSSDESAAKWRNSCCHGSELLNISQAQLSIVLRVLHLSDDLTLNGSVP